MIFFCASIEGPAVLIVIVLGVWIWNLLAKLFETWTAREQSDPMCKHGIRGGGTKDLCSQCSAEMRDERQRWELQKREKERLAAIRTAALELRSKEHRRLTEVRLHQRDYLLGITPEDFEVAVVRLFKQMGFDAEKTPLSNDRGRDAVLTKDGRTDLVQCKRYAVENIVGRPAIQQFLGTIQSERADGGYFVTTSDYSKGAIEVAEAHGIHLIDGKTLCKMMLRYFGDAGAKTYRTMCVMCGEEVAFDLDSCETVKACSNRHPVNLDFDQHIFRMNLDGTTPMCPRCGKSVRIIDGRRGKFFGCSGYPDCHFTAEYSPCSATAKSGGSGSKYHEPEEPVPSRPMKHPAEDFLRATKDARATQSAKMPALISTPFIARKRSGTPKPQSQIPENQSQPQSPQGELADLAAAPEQPEPSVRYSDPDEGKFHEAIPHEKIEGMVPAIAKLAKEASTPKAFAESIIRLGPKAPQYVQSLWSVAKATGAQGPAEPNWQEIFNNIRGVIAPKKDETPASAPAPNEHTKSQSSLLAARALREGPPALREDFDRPPSELSPHERSILDMPTNRLPENQS
jgi:restriction system protein